MSFLAEGVESCKLCVLTVLLFLDDVVQNTALFRQIPFNVSGLARSYIGDCLALCGENHHFFVVEGNLLRKRIDFVLDFLQRAHETIRQQLPVAL